jgi:hypothetical protein
LIQIGLVSPGIGVVRRLARVAAAPMVTPRRIIVDGGALLDAVTPDYRDERIVRLETIIETARPDAVTLRITSPE